MKMPPFFFSWSLETLTAPNHGPVQDIPSFRRNFCPCPVN